MQRIAKTSDKYGILNMRDRAGCSQWKCFRCSFWWRNKTMPRPFGGEAGLARRESLQLRPCWPNIEPQMMIGQKEEKKSWVARPVSQTNQRPPKPALIGKGANCRSKKLTPFLGPDLVLQTSFLPMHVLLKVNPWRVHLPCQLTRRQKHDSTSLCAIVAINYCSMSAMVISAAYSAACF